MVSDKENGLLVEPEDVQGLADAICWADHNRGVLREMTKAAREKIVKNFNRNECTKKLLAAINIEITGN